jgi:hypothetical protein
MKRDRDNTVTDSLPVLVSSYSRGDGFILPPDGLQIEAQILPIAAAEGIFDAKKRRAYSRVYDKISPEELAELQALLLLISAVEQPTKEVVKQYLERMAPLEVKRAVERLVEGLRQWGGSVSEQQKEIERARVLHQLQERIKFPWHELNWQLNGWLKKPSVVLWLRSRDKRLSPGLYCRNMAAAVAALLFSRIASPQAISVCQRCSSPFVRIKRVQRFCSLRCGNADRKARERAKFQRRTKP